MYTVSDRTLRNYRNRLKKGAPFHINLKTLMGPVEIFVDSAGWASLRDGPAPDGKFSLSMGSAATLVDCIARGVPLPDAKPQWRAQEESEVPLAPIKITDYEESKMTETRVNYTTAEEGGLEEKLEEKPKERKRNIPTGDALKVIPAVQTVITALLAGEKKSHANWDKLVDAGEFVDWNWTERRQVEKKWTSINTYIIATAHFGDSVITYPIEQDALRAVLLRRAALHQSCESAGLSIEESEGVVTIHLA